MNSAKASSVGRVDAAEAQQLEDEELERRMYPPPRVVAAEQRAAVDWATVHQERRRKGVTLQLLWEEYQQREPQGYRYL